MPVKALSCHVDIDIHALSSPGTRLTKQDDLYVAVRLFGQVQRTKLVEPLFPLIFHDKLRFSKVFYTAYEPSQVAEALQDMMVRIDLIQESDLYSDGRLLAWYDSSVRHFLYPHPTYMPSYGIHDRELLLERSVLFPGISPKLEFSTKTVIKDAENFLLDPSSLDEDTAVRGRDTERGRQSRRRSTSRGRSYGRPTVSSATRSRSMSPGPRAALNRVSARSVSPWLRKELKEMNQSGGGDSPVSGDERPPFVVRKVDKGLIDRRPAVPGSLATNGSMKSSGRKTNGAVNGSEWPASSRCAVCLMYKKIYGKSYDYHSHATNKPQTSAASQPLLSSFPPSSNKEGVVNDVGRCSCGYNWRRTNETSGPRSYTNGYESDSEDDVVGRRSQSRERYRPYYYDEVDDDLSLDLLRERVRQAMRRNRHRERLDHLLTYQRYLRAPYYRDDTLAQLELDLELARRRR